MVADQPAPALPAGEPGITKIRIRFQKSGDLRFVSHHDLMHCFERMLRRSGLPFLNTQGFHPHPRIVFPLSLALGVIGRREVVEIEFGGDITPQEVASRLAPHTPPGLQINEVQAISRKTRGQARWVTYTLQLPDTPAPELQERIANLLASATLVVERLRPERKRLDVRPYVKSVRLEQRSLHLDLWVTPNGTARPDEILAALGLDQLVQTGAVLERTELELIDELPESEAAISITPLTMPAEDSQPEQHLAQESKSDSSKHRQPTPLISGPLNFDS